ncbi:hypothetical protein LAT59_01210 [Candidatus Gracilibacteria bacterium]|nr:hypothetical protein [Candidatus Gracilibacteria bacterium]
MFQKIKNIKKYIKIAKIAALAFAVSYVLLIAHTFYQSVQIGELEKRIEFLETTFR